MLGMSGAGDRTEHKGKKEHKSTQTTDWINKDDSGEVENPVEVACEELVRCYGFFRCGNRKCKPIRLWESNHVYCKTETTEDAIYYEAVYKQECKRCKQAVLPYDVEEMICSRCKKTNVFCTCMKRKHHVDPKRPHLTELCGKCKDGYPCCQTECTSKLEEEEQEQKD